MSEVYITEPPLKGKVVLHTTHGDLDIELWSKECPKATRNFVQLCVNNYYNNTIFHRIISDFIVQGGDPTGTGNGGESIYGENIPIETHSRLKFRYRGLVGVASGKDGSTGSQFFMTLGRADFLNNKHTLFGKLTGNSIYNLLKMAESPTDKNERPTDPPYIISTEVLYNPFDDIQPTIPISTQSDEIDNEKSKIEKREILSHKQKQLLSFEEEEDETPTHFKHKSAHDLLDDPRLLKEEIDYSFHTSKRPTHTPKIEHTVKLDTIKPNKVEEPPSKKQEHPVETPSTTHTEPSNNTLTFKKGHGTSNKRRHDLDHVQDNDLLSEKEKRYQLQISEKRNVNKQKREEDTFTKFLEFNKRLKQISSQKPKPNTQPEPAILDTFLPNFDEVIDESDGTWLLGDGLKFAVDSQRAYDLDEARDSLAVYDPLTADDAKEAEKFRKQTRRKPQVVPARGGQVEKW